MQILFGEGLHQLVATTCCADTDFTIYNVLWIQISLSLIYVYCVHSSEFVCGDTSPESPHGTPFLVIL